MIVTDSHELAERCRRFRNFGDHGKFEWAENGLNFRLPEALGAVGLVQLNRLEESIRRRRAIGRRYTEAFGALPGVITPKERTPTDGIYQLYTVRFDVGAGSPPRDAVRDALTRRGVGCRTYFPALHRQGVFADFDPPGDEAYPNASRFHDTALSLPIFPTLDTEQQDFVIENLLAAVDEAERS